MISRVALAQVVAGEDREANLREAITIIEKAADAGAGLICFPEMGFTRFFPQFPANPRYFDWAEPIPGEIVARLQKVATARRIAIVANLFERALPGEYYNCSPVIDRDGAYLGRSRMAHIAEAPQFNEKYYYRPGTGEFQVFETGAGRVGIAVCYDRHYPEQVRILTVRGCEILLVPLAAIAADHWTMFEMEMQVTSFQNQIFTVVVNRVGQEDAMTFLGRSFVTDPFGEVIARAADKQPDLLLVDLDLDRIEQARRETPHLRDRRPELYGPLAHLL